MKHKNFETVLRAFVRWQSVVDDGWIRDEPVNEEEQELYNEFDRATDIYIGMGVDLYERIMERMGK